MLENIQPHETLTRSQRTDPEEKGQEKKIKCACPMHAFTVHGDTFGKSYQTGPKAGKTKKQ